MSAAPTPDEGLETLTLAKAINSGLQQAMLADDRVIMMGEDIGTLGGVFTVTDGLKAEFGDKRVLDTPLAESGIIGTAIGLAMRGYRPVCEIQFDGFIFPGFDQITSQLAKLTARHEGSLTMPVVIRVPYGGHIGAVEHHQESPEAYFAHTALLALERLRHSGRADRRQRRARELRRHERQPRRGSQRTRPSIH